LSRYCIEGMWVCSYIGGYKYVINIELRPTDNVSPDKDYVVELYRNEGLMDSKALGWAPQRKIPRPVKNTPKPI